MVQVNFCILVLLIWLTPTFGQRGTKILSSDISQYGYTTWSNRSGSFRGGVRTIAQTSDGYLWLGTGFGLVRFDGVRFTEWNPPQPNDSFPEAEVSALLGARDGSLWIGQVNRGLTQWKDGRLTRFPELDGGSVFAIMEDHEGTIWVGGGHENKTLCRIRSGVLGCFEDKKVPNSPVSFLYQDREGRIWASLLPNQLCEMQLDNPLCYSDPNGVAGDMVEDAEGRLVLAGNGRLRFLSLNGKIEDYPLRLDGQGIFARSLLVDREGSLWIGTSGKGLVHVREGRVDTFTKNDGLYSNTSFFKIFEDREGTVWVASLANLDRFRRLAIPSMTERQGLSSDPFSILSAQDGTIWLGTENGLDHIKDNTIEVYNKHNGLANYVNSMLQTLDGRILAATGKLSLVEKGHLINLPVDIGDNVFGIVEDARGDLWLVSNTVGLIHLNKAGTLIEKFAKQTLPLRIYQLAYDPVRDGLWIAAKDGNLGFFKNGKIIEHYGPGDGLGTGKLSDVQVKKDGTVWVGTRVGLARLRNSKIDILNQEAGLPCNATHWIRADDEGTFWLYTECGIVHLSQEDLAAWDAQPNHRVTPLDFFNNMDGVDNNPLGPWYSPPVAKTSDGRLLFVQYSGLGIIDPRHIVRNVLPPPVHIEGMIADRRNYPPQDNLNLPALTRDLEIDYTALSLVVPEKVRFRYILEGHDADWQDPGNRRHAFYNDLRPGKYTFRVIACNNDGVWNKTGASLIFLVAPAWYQTYWFLLLCTVTGLIVVWAIYNLRVRQIARAISVRFDERLAERTRIARELHDTLLQTVQGSKLVADNALEKPNDVGHLHHAMKQLSGWLGQATQEGRTALNSLRTSSIETNDLAAGLRRAIEECVIDQSIAVKFSIVGSAKDMHPIARDEVYRIGYEAIRNACEHASASELEITLTYAQNLTLRVRDNGIGMEAAVVTEGREGHFGLQGMRERAERIGSKFTLNSAPNSGTEMTLVVPGNVIFRKGSVTRVERIKTFFGLDRSSDLH